MTCLRHVRARPTKARSSRRESNPSGRTKKRNAAFWLRSFFFAVSGDSKEERY